jgi:hypothetical protein
MADGQDRLTNDAFILEDDTFGGSNTSFTPEEIMR